MNRKDIIISNSTTRYLDIVEHTAQNQAAYWSGINEGTKSTGIKNNSQRKWALKSFESSYWLTSSIAYFYTDFYLSHKSPACGNECAGSCEGAVPDSTSESMHALPVSYDAMKVVARVFPIDFLTVGRLTIYESRKRHLEIPRSRKTRAVSIKKNTVRKLRTRFIDGEKVGWIKISI